MLQLLLITMTACIPSPRATSQLPTEIDYAQEPPGITPIVFRPGFISRDNRFEQSLVLSPDGSEMYFGVTNSTWGAFTFLHTKYENGEWTTPATAAFLGSSDDALTASFSTDMNEVLFTSVRPSYPPGNIWMGERVDGNWIEPIKMDHPLSSPADEFEVSLSSAGTLYFSSARSGGHGGLDVYHCRWNGVWPPVVLNLGPNINTVHDDDLPAPAPDDSYLVFGSTRPGGLGNRDLYVSFKVDGEWTPAVSLGSTINTAEFEIYPTISPDGKYLFFSRRKAWYTSVDSDIWWVSTQVIEDLRPAGDPGGGDGGDDG